MKRRLDCIIVSTISALLFSLNLYAQQAIRGVLRSPAGEPVSGATIVVKGTDRSTLSNSNGEFSINASPGNILVVSYVGYQTKEVTLGTENDLNISLVAAISNMDEVVVVGYGTQRRRDVTGSVVSISTKNLPQAANVSINNLLQGRAAGLNLSQRSAQPGGGLSISIRGAGAPLYVIDGVPLFNNRAPEPGINDKDLGYSGGVDRDPLSTINPADIESIDVLKDASAAAIYGSAAAYGVILITTKKGKGSKINSEYRGSYTVQSPKDYFPFLNGKEFMQQQVRLARDKFLYDNNLSPYGTSTATPVFTPLFTEAQIDAAGEGTDWLDMLIRNGRIQEHNISISGGADKTRIFTSFNYYNNTATIENSDFVRYTGRINLDQQLGSRLKLSVNLTMSQVNSNNAASGSNSGGQEKYNELQAAYAYVPTVAVYDASGNYSKSLNRLITNPAAFFSITDKLKTNRFFVAPNLEIKVFDGLKINFVGGVDKQGSKRNFYMPRAVGNAQLPEGAAQLASNTIENYSFEGYGTFNKVLNQHNLSVVAGGGYYKNINESFGLQAVGFFTDALNVYDVNSATNKDKSFMNSFKGESTKISQFLRVNYTYQSKYILTFNARRDGSSNFARDKKWGFFPGVSVGWQINQEPFLSSSKVISTLKFRAGYGEVGYDADLNALRLYRRVPDGGFVFGSTLYPGVMLSQLDNPTLSWETDKSTNIGIDYGLFNDRITGSFEVFRRDASDLLRQVPLPVNNAVQRYQTNLGGTTRSEGIDFSVNSKNTTGAFRWETLLNISKYRNRWLERSPYDVLNPLYQRPDDRTDIVYGWQTNGIMKQASEKPSHMPNARLGNLVYVDQNKDGKLDGSDVVALGYRDPKWVFGLGNTFSYKKIEINIFMYGRIKQYMGNNFAGFYNPSRIAVADAQNTLVGIKNVWSVDNPSGIYPGIAANAHAGSNPSGTTDFLQENVSYLKIRNVTLSYTFNVTKFIQSARVFADFQNLATFTNYKGYDPELSEANPYPQALSTTIGVSINF